MNKACTWDDLANAYDNNHSGRRARTLPFEAICKWAVARTDLFKVGEDDCFYTVSEKCKQIMTTLADTGGG